MTTKDRILQFIKYKNLNPRQFEIRSGLSNAYVKNMRKSIGEEKLKQIGNAFPELNIVWLKMGEGEMLKVTDEEIDIAEEGVENLYTNQQNLIKMNKMLGAYERTIRAQEVTIELLQKENQFLKSEIEVLNRQTGTNG